MALDPSRRRRRKARWKAWVDDWWFAACGIALIVGSDFDFRVRPPGVATSGGIDIGVMFELALYGAVGVYVLQAHARRPRIRRLPVHLYLACCFVGLVVLSVTYAVYPQYALVRAGQLVVLLGLVAAVMLDGGRAHLHRFAHAYLILICAAVFYGLARPSPPLNRLQEGRFTWLAIHPTLSGVLASLATVLAASYLCGGRRDRPGPRWPIAVYVLILAIVGGAMLAAQTRGAVAGGVAGIIVVLGASLRPRAIVDFVIGLVVVSVGAALVGAEVVGRYFARGGDSSDLTSLNSRTDLWDVAIDYILRSPLFGYGVSSSTGIFYDEIGLGGGHNAAVNVVVELGLVGLVLWLSIVIALWVGLRRIPRDGEQDMRLDRAMLMGLVIFLMIDGVFFEGPGSVANVASTWFFVCIAWLAVLQRDSAAARDAFSAPSPVAAGVDR